MIDNVQVPPFSQSFIPSRITRDGAVTAVLGSRAARASAAACGCAPGARDSCIMTMYFLVINQSHGVWFLKLNEHINGSARWMERRSASRTLYSAYQASKFARKTIDVL